MTNTAATELRKFDGTRYMAQEESVYTREKGNYEIDHGFVNKNFVRDSGGDSMLVSNDLNDAKVHIYEYDSFFHIPTSHSCLLLQYKIALCFETYTHTFHYLTLLYKILEHVASKSSV